MQLGKILNSQGRDYNDLFIVKVSTKKYSILFSDTTINSRAVLSSSRNSGSSNTKPSMEKCRRASYSLTESGKICSIRKFWRTNTSSTSLAIFLNNKECINNHKLTKMFDRPRINIFWTKFMRT